MWVSARAPRAAGDRRRAAQRRRRDHRGAHKREEGGGGPWASSQSSGRDACSRPDPRVTAVIHPARPRWRCTAEGGQLDRQEWAAACGVLVAPESHQCRASQTGRGGGQHDHRQPEAASSAGTRFRRRRGQRRSRTGARRAPRRRPARQQKPRRARVGQASVAPRTTDLPQRPIPREASAASVSPASGVASAPNELARWRHRGPGTRPSDQGEVTAPSSIRPTETQGRCPTTGRRSGGGAAGPRMKNTSRCRLDRCTGLRRDRPAPGWPTAPARTRASCRRGQHHGSTAAISTGRTSRCSMARNRQPRATRTDMISNSGGSAAARRGSALHDRRWTRR